MQITKDSVKRVLKRIGRAIANPNYLLCFALAWMVTNGWCYLFILFGRLFNISWMSWVGGAYAALLWLPFTPEKILTLGLSILFLRLLFPKDERTLQLLRDEHELLKRKLRSHREKKRQEKETGEEQL